MRIAMMGVIIALTAGCGQVTTEEKPEGESRAHAVTRDTVETVTGGKAIKAQMQTQDKINQIGASHTEDLNDVGVESK